MPAYPTSMKPQTRPKTLNGGKYVVPRLHNPANINSPPGKYRPPKQRPGYKKTATPAWRPTKYRPPVKKPLLKLAQDPWKQLPLPKPGLSPGQALKLAKVTHTLFKYGKVHPARTALEILLQLYPELYPHRNPRHFYMPMAENGYQYCWGTRPNCGHTVSDGMSVGGGSVCITNLACATNQVYSAAQTAMMQALQPVTGLGRRILFGKITNIPLTRFTLHEAWHFPTVNVPAFIQPRSIVYGYPLPFWFDTLPQPRPEVGYKYPKPPEDLPQTPDRRLRNDQRHVARKPGPRRKEGKRNPAGVGFANAAGLLAGETGDIVGALYKALPWHVQNWRDDTTIQSKAIKLWNNWRKVDLGKAIKNLAGNQLEDMALGKFGSVGKAAVKKAAKGGYWTGERGFASGTGFRDLKVNF